MGVCVHIPHTISDTEDEEMAQCFGAPATLAEYPGSVTTPTWWHTTLSSRESDASSDLLAPGTHAMHIHICRQNMHTYKINILNGK